ncbi:MAG TPA: DinB family protein [Candidatus Krumholzibacteria bacterium]|nr:DinB family protein [Candidatus Krumholzibacteria bacterium]
MTTVRLEVWLRGPVYGIPALLMPVAHALAQAAEDARDAVAGLTRDELLARPGGAASVAFHLFHAAHALDRLMTYARGEALSDSQRAALAVERAAEFDADAAELLDQLDAAVERALRQLRCTPENSLLSDRSIGRQRFETTVLGLLFHAAEHTSRHVGQLITTALIVSAARG